MIAVRIKALYIHHIVALLIFVTLIFFYFTLFLNDYYFTMVYCSFKKFGTYNHNIWRYQLDQILESDLSLKKVTVNPKRRI